MLPIFDLNRRSPVLNVIGSSSTVNDLLKLQFVIVNSTFAYPLSLYAYFEFNR